MITSSAHAQAAYGLRAIFRNITGTPACYGYPAGGSPISGECAAASSNAFYFLPSPAITGNMSQRLTTIRWFLNAGNSDVSYANITAMMIHEHHTFASSSLHHTFSRCTGVQLVQPATDILPGRVIHRHHPMAHLQLRVLPPGATQAAGTTHWKQHASIICTLFSF
jgi:hypothetical protein